MEKTIHNVKTWTKGGPASGFIDAAGKAIELPDIEWDQIEYITLEGVKSVEMDYTGPMITGEEKFLFKQPVSCLLDEGEYEDIRAIRTGSMICKPQIKGLERF